MDHLAPVFAQYPIEVVAAEGVWLTTRDGRRILDLYGGHAVAALGYGHAGWLAALDSQARAVHFQSNAVPMEVRARAARRLVEFANLPLDTVFFVSTGAEANENALKLACRITGRAQVVALEGSFHGRSAAAGAVTWGAMAKWYGFPRAPFDVAFLPRRDASALAAGITGATAAVIVEPVQGVGGAFDMGRDYLAALRARCDATGALLIFDEVQCGMGRTGHPFAANLYGVVPDMITTAKALGAGFPVGALLTGAKVAAALKPDALGTTFGGGPLACAVVTAVIDAIEGEGLLGNVRRVSGLIRETCVVGPVTGTQGEGFLLGLKTRRPAKEVHAALLARDILAGTSGDPQVLRLLPPFTLADTHVALLRDALVDIGA
ncbi:MAG TPA: aminotransferase class III-fold pyridoxal phosphate-dependent enzyme [Steroidobacteraceae bacterium]|nr:aminotransferase class III-fold pyridoxal phosphate-dependent enzyme [Steroidobacteraceae bacterium]